MIERPLICGKETVRAILSAGVEVSLWGRERSATKIDGNNVKVRNDESGSGE